MVWSSVALRVVSETSTLLTVYRVCFWPFWLNLLCRDLHYMTNQLAQNPQKQWSHISGADIDMLTVIPFNRSFIITRSSCTTILHLRVISNWTNCATAGTTITMRKHVRKQTKSHDLLHSRKEQWRMILDLLISRGQTNSWTHHGVKVSICR